MVELRIKKKILLKEKKRYNIIVLRKIKKNNKVDNYKVGININYNENEC